MTTKEKIEQLLHEAFTLSHLEVIDDSAKHAGHRGVKEAGGGGHFQILIIASDFEGQTRIARHRMVNKALASLIPKEIHALGIRAHSPIEYNIAES